MSESHTLSNAQLELPADAVEILAQFHETRRNTLVQGNAGDIAELFKLLDRDQVKTLRAPRIATHLPLVHAASLKEGKDRPLRIFYERLLFTTVKDGCFGIVRRLKSMYPFDYQIAGVMKLMQNGKNVHPDHRHSILLACWETGAGKTGWAMLAIGAAYRECVDKKAFRAIVSVPIGAVDQWKRAAYTWLTLPKSRILVATKRKQITAKHRCNAMLVITTPSAVVEVYKEFMWLNKFAIEVPQSSGESKWLAKFERLPRPSAKQRVEHPDWNAEGPPPIPALFNLPKITITILDEANDFSNRDTYTAQAARLLNANAMYSGLLSATPVSNSADEFADLMFTLAAEEKYQRRDFYVSHTESGFSIKKSAIIDAHAANVHRVSESEVDLPKLHHVRILFHPHIGRTADGSYNSTTIDGYNNTVAEAKRTAGGETGNKTVQGSHHSSKLMVCIGRLDQITFDSHLGQIGADSYKVSNIANSLQNTSQSLLLFHRVVLEIQQTAGRRRVLAFCPSSAMIKIAMAFFERKRRTGAIFSIVGSHGSALRDRTVTEFLKTRGSAVLFVTTAGGTSLNIDQGCETVVTFGSAGWSPTVIKQAVGRVRRVTQKFSCLHVEIVALAGPSNCQLTELQTDKATRLQKAFHDVDFTGFKKRGRRAFRDEEEEDDDYEDVDEQPWRKRAKLAGALTFVEKEGTRTGNAKPCWDTQTHINRLVNGEDVPEDLAMFMDSAPPLAKDLVLEEWPARNLPRN